MDHSREYSFFSTLPSRSAVWIELLADQKRRLQLSLMTDCHASGKTESSPESSAEEPSKPGASASHGPGVSLLTMTIGISNSPQGERTRGQQRRDLWGLGDSWRRKEQASRKPGATRRGKSKTAKRRRNTCPTCFLPPGKRDDINGKSSSTVYGVTCSLKLSAAQKRCSCN